MADKTTQYDRMVSIRTSPADRRRLRLICELTGKGQADVIRELIAREHARVISEHNVEVVVSPR